MTQPYVSVAEFKAAPTAIDVSTLDVTNKGNSSAQDAALLSVLRRASAWVDNICSQSLSASITTETKEVHLTRDGRFAVHVDNTPIIAVTNAQYRLYPAMTYGTIDPSQIQTFDTWFTVFGVTTYVPSPQFVIQNPQFGYLSPWQRQTLSDLPVTIQYTYSSGYMNTTLNGAVVSAAATITVLDATGAYAGLRFTIPDGPNTEYCVVDSVAGNVITLKSPLLFAHVDKTPTSAVPDDIKEATLLLASVLIRERGSVAVMMNEMSMQGVSNAYVKSDDVSTARTLLKPYVRAVTS